ncbi:MAG: GntR family transcriptional regulator [Bacillota bacterium]|nr:GntR family transcriptional regulator [Bacillota bacterium]
MKISIPTTWKLDQHSNVPLNVQLCENIRWSISSGEMPPGSLLPPIRELAQALGISLNTVKTAYRELQQSGLLVSRRGYGTTVVSPDQHPHTGTHTAEQAVERAMRSAMEAGYSPEQLRELMERLLARYRTDYRSLTLLFVECDETQLELLGQDIRSALGLRVEKVLTGRLAQERDRLARHRDRYAGIATTYFHYREVRDALGHLGLPILGLVLATSASTLNRLSQVPAGATVGCVCRDPETLPSFSSIVVKLVTPGVRVTSCLLGDTAGLDALAREASVIVCTVPCLRPLGERLRGREVYPLYDRVDPGSLHILAQHFSVPAREAAATCQLPGE